MTGVCSSCGRSWVGQHRCGERSEEAALTKRVAELEAENGRLRALILDAQVRVERMAGLFK